MIHQCTSCGKIKPIEWAFEMPAYHKTYYICKECLPKIYERMNKKSQKTLKYKKPVILEKVRGCKHGRSC